MQMLQNQSVKFFEYQKFDISQNLENGRYMILDSQAIDQLEVAESISNGK